METINKESFHIHRIDYKGGEWSNHEIKECFNIYDYFYERILKGAYGYDDGSGFYILDKLYSGLLIMTRFTKINIKIILLIYVLQQSMN